MELAPIAVASKRGRSQRWHNQVASEQTYDRESGVRTNRWVNVDGNWTTNYNLWCYVPLNAQRNLTLQTRMGANVCVKPSEP